jgi:short-subunit dehydrogenase
MTLQALIVGGTGGIGSSCAKQLVNNDYKISLLNSDQLDLNFPERIFDHDFSKFDLLLNCAGHSQGTYLGFLKNTWQNQLSQVTVNYTSNLFLLKHYANSCSKGKYVWFSTTLLDQACPYHSTYAGSKAGSRFAIDLIRNETTHINILEVKVGPTKTNFRYRNFEGARSHDEVNIMYDQESALDPDYVAAETVAAIQQNQKYIHIK